MTQDQLIRGLNTKNISIPNAVMVANAKHASMNRSGQRHPMRSSRLTSIAGAPRQNLLNGHIKFLLDCDPFWSAYLKMEYCV